MLFIPSWSKKIDHKRIFLLTIFISLTLFYADLYSCSPNISIFTGTQEPACASSYHSASVYGHVSNRLISIDFRTLCPNLKLPLKSKNYAQLKNTFAHQYQFANTSLIRSYPSPKLRPFSNKLLYNKAALDHCLQSGICFRNTSGEIVLMDLTPCHGIFPDNFIQRKSQYTLDVSNAFVFKDGFVITCLPVSAFNQSGSDSTHSLVVIRGGGCGTENMDVPRKLSHFSHFKQISHEKVILVDQAWAYTYYHFINEAFMRLFQLNNVKQLVQDKDQYFIVPQSGHFVGSSGRKYVEDLFELMGVEKRRLITVSSNEGLLVKHLMIPKPIFCCNPQPEQLQKAQMYFWTEISQANHKKNRIKPENGAASCKDSRWILVIKRSSYRSIMNHDQMMESLQEWFPCETFKVFSGGAAKDTAFLFSGSKVIIGPHGAGFGNLIFTRPPDANHSLSVIEVLQPHQLRVYCRVALMVGAKYYAMLSKILHVSQQLIWFKVDVEEMGGILYRALADSGKNPIYKGPSTSRKSKLYEVYGDMCEYTAGRMEFEHQ